jgi:hypothetical protein
MESDPRSLSTVTSVVEGDPAAIEGGKKYRPKAV